MPLLKLSQILQGIFWAFVYFIWFRRQVTVNYYFLNLNVSDENWVREQFCHQLDFFDLQTVKKLQLIDSAACRKLRFNLAKTNLIEFCIMKDKKNALDVKAIVLQLIFSVT